MFTIAAGRCQDGARLAFAYQIPCRRQDFSMRKIDAYPLPAVADAQSMPDTDFDRMQAAGGAQYGADRHRTTRPLAI